MVERSTLRQGWQQHPQDPGNSGAQSAPLLALCARPARLTPEQGKDAAELDQLWRDYFVVTFVRSPYQRAVSAYRMMARQLARGGELEASFSWAAFCADPADFGGACDGDPRCML